MATKLPALNLRHTVSPREIQDLASAAVSELVGGGTPPAGSGYAANPHTLSGATHTGLLGSSQATQFAYNEGNGADDDSDRSAYNANRMTGGKAHVVPVTTDTYDLGTSSKWWRGQYVSTINAAIFAENVIQLLGGWFIVGHNQGTLDSAVATATTSIDFGTALTVNDFILIKGHDTAGAVKTEYMQVTASVPSTERVTNGTFTVDITGWTDASDAGASIASDPPYMNLISDGVGTARARGTVLTTVANVAYTLSVTKGADAITYKVGTSAGASDIATGSLAFGSGTKTANFTATSTTTYIELSTVQNTTAVIDTVSVMATSATWYTVTRDVSTANGTDPAWAIGTPFLVLGYTGDGRIEFDAYDTPRIQLFTQGSTYNAQTEVVRVGDLNANWGYVAETYGIAMGDYQSGVANVCIDATNGVRLRSYQTTKIQLQPDGDVFIGSDISAAATTGIVVFSNAQTYNGEADVFADGDILIGDNTASKANIFWDKSEGILNFRGGTTTHLQVTTAGALTAGEGKVKLDSSGISVLVADVEADSNAYALRDGTGAITGGVYGLTGDVGVQTELNSNAIAGKWGSIQINARAPSTYLASNMLQATSGATSTYLAIYADSNGSPTTSGTCDASTFTFSGNIAVGGTVDGVDVGAHAAATGSSVHGLGTLSTQASNAVAITGGTISGLTTLGASAAAITGGSVIGLTDLQVGSGTRKAFTVSQTNADVYIGSDSQDGDLYMRKLDGTGTVHLIGSSGDIYIDNNMSALSFTDRTPHFVGDALEAIRGIKGDAKSLDHKTLPAFAQYQNIRKHRASGGTEEVTTTTERNLGNMVTLLTVAVQQLLDRVEKIEQVAHI